jgi:prevent-host-death family protein
MEVRQKLGDILNRVALRQDEFIIERRGKQLAAVVPVERLRQMRETSRRVLLNVLETRRDRSMSDSKTMALADEAKHRGRPHRRG